MNGQDCHDCLIFLLKSIRSRAKEPFILFLTDKTLAASGKREIISDVNKTIAGKELPIKDEHFFFVQKTAVTFNQKTYPILLVRNKHNGAELIDYDHVWKAMNDSTYSLPL